MRFPSYSSLQFLATATTDTVMSSSRAPYRGRNSWRRDFSGRQSGGRDEFVSGDSHLDSVESANYASRQVEGGNFPSGFHQPPFRQGRPFHPPPHFRQPPHFHQPQPLQPPHFGQPPPFQQGQPFHQPPPWQQRRPPPFQQEHRPFRQPRPIRPPNYKPPDYRNWEYALSQPPSECERFVVLSYNILADYLAMNHRRELYSHIPYHILDWEWRRRKILFELGLWSPDIMCLQEVDRFQDLEEELKLYGYNGIWKMRTGIPVDGCAIFWRTTRFSLLHEESIEYNKLGLRDNVAQICVLESINQNCADNISGALPQSSNRANQVVICNTHVLYNPRRGEIKLGQIRVLLNRAYAVSKLWDGAPVIICGDFNCTPKSPLYNFISEQKLDLTGLPRDQLSGQSSAEIRTPRPYTTNPGHVSFRVQAPDNSNKASMLSEEREVSVKQSDCMPDMQDLNEPNRDGESAPFKNDLHRSQSVAGVGSISDKSCLDVYNREENHAISDESSNDIEHEMIGTSKNSVSLSCNDPVELVSVDSGNDKVQDLTSPLMSCDSGSAVVVENGHGHQSIGFMDHSLPETLTKHSQPNSCTSELANSAMQEGLVDDAMARGAPYIKEKLTSIDSNVDYTESRRDEKLENAFVQDITLDLVPDTSFAHENKASLSESLGSSTPELITDISEVSTWVDFNMDQKLDEINEGIVGQSSTSTPLSEVCRTQDVVQSNVDQHSRYGGPESSETDQCVEEHDSSLQKLHLSSPCDEIQGDSFSINSGLATTKINTYDPSSWTAMEIEIASGNAECTFLEHPLKLKSTYAEVEDYSGTRDSCREPEVTSYNRRFMGTVDYIWCSEGLHTVKVLDTIPKNALRWTPGFPTPKWGSDHIALVSQLAFTKGMDRS